MLGIALCPLLLGSGRWRARLRRVNSVVEPAAVVLLAICYPVISQAQTAQFYIGWGTIRYALYDFVSQTVRAVPGHGGWLGSPAVMRVLAYGLLPVVTLLVIATFVRQFRRGPDPRRSLLPALTLLLALAAIFASHRLLGFNYPIDRLTLPLFVLLALAWAGAVSRIPSRAFRVANGAIAIVLIAQFASQFHLRYFSLWLHDASTKQVAQYLRDATRAAPPGSVSVSATWYMTPALEYYRRVYRIAALQPIERREPTPFDGFDYYVLDRPDQPLKAAVTPGLRPLFSDPLSGVIVTQ